ncbi:hypothetical protein Kfla_3300 [Kribbella flavida DSM 17836]|uniref:Secreted protein n=1 Tax=Kribbella flavida (strain DSM 17836 / JCM 10339 / NBRC 14399) TaxID=479435 RepID=D2PKP4_KRIFD|nr:hypothetical protein [Kribbella flavida]ADB32361.1 hypothetical protein Kfla_3300 [Kribbella flavida DSM 17836]
MRNRVARGFIALSTVLALMVSLPAPTATASTIHLGDGVCSMYANSNGFGAYCSAGQVSWGNNPPTWRQTLGGRPFIPCRDFPVPGGIELAEPPPGKEWVLRLTIVDYQLDTNDGGDDAHLERAIVPVSAEERRQCLPESYMDQFWTFFDEAYPDPVLLVKPTYTPRVNVPAYFALAPETSYVLKNYGSVESRNFANYKPGTRLTMRAMVTRLTVDPGDGTKPFDCLEGTLPIGSDGYEETQDPFHQASTCSHVYKRSSAKQPEGMYTVKLTIHWRVDYWRGPDRLQDWTKVGEADVHAVQRLPVQEVQAIGG